MDIKLSNLNKTIINCKKCPRLVKFVNKVSNDKRKQNRDEIYWGKPVPGFGNLNSKLAIIGLAPAAFIILQMFRYGNHLPLLIFQILYS